MWQEKENNLYQKYKFQDFDTAFAFMTAAAAVFKKYNHHPRWLNEWDEVEVWLTTHSQGSIVTELDQQVAQELDAIARQLQVPAEVKSNPTESSVEEHVKLFTDGGSRGNPGPSAGAFVIYKLDDTVVKKAGFYIGITTNNQAEFQALKRGLEELRTMNIKQVDVFMDSLLVVNQIKGIYKVKNRDLWPIYQSVIELSKQFRQFTINHVPRELNKDADQEVNRILDEQKSTV